MSEICASTKRILLNDRSTSTLAQNLYPELYNNINVIYNHGKKTEQKQQDSQNSSENFIQKVSEYKIRIREKQIQSDQSKKEKYSDQSKKEKYSDQSNKDKYSDQSKKYIQSNQSQKEKQSDIKDILYNKYDKQKDNSTDHQQSNNSYNQNQISQQKTQQIQINNKNSLFNQSNSSNKTINNMSLFPHIQFMNMKHNNSIIPVLPSFLIKQ